MSKQLQEIQNPLIDSLDSQPTIPTPITWNEFEYKEFANAPKIMLSGLTLIIVCPILLVAHIRVSILAGIPLIQFAFVTTLCAFLLNYTAIIRKYQLMPYLPQSLYDAKLKRMCIMGVIGLLISLVYGWNGSGGILFAMAWESMRNNRLGFVGYMLVVIIVGSLILEQNLYWKKLIQFIPGLLFGMINSTLFTLQQSSFYAITHQFLLLTSITLPILFPAFHIIVPNIWQWILMLICGTTILLTTVMTVKLMQSQRVSVVMGVTSGVMMIGTCQFHTHWDFVGVAVILVGIVFIVKKQYIDVSY